MTACILRGGEGWRVVSTDRRNTCIKTLCGSFVSQRHTWSFVELSCNGAQLCLTMYGIEASRLFAAGASFPTPVPTTYGFLKN